MMEHEEIVEMAPEAEEVVATEAPDHAVVASPAGTATLVVVRNNVETDEVFTFAPPATIGRFDPSVGPIDIDLGGMPEGSYVSRKHAKITCEDGVWKLHDLGSSNGCYIKRDDFDKIEEAELADGAEIALGNARFVFHLSGETPAE